jgi:hypothetical protein
MQEQGGAISREALRDPATEAVRGSGYQDPGVL